jgi:hypothetical protein
LGVFPTIFANNAKGTHLYNRVLAALYRPIIIPRKRFPTGWATPFLPSDEIFLETNSGTAKAPQRDPVIRTRMCLCHSVIFAVTAIYFPFSMLFKNIDNWKRKYAACRV